MTTLSRCLSAVVVIVVLAVLGVPVAAAQPAGTDAAASPCRRTLPSYPVLHPGDRGPAVRTLQCDLNDLGLGPVEVDGYYGPQTKRAVWQISQNFEGDIADPYEITPGFWALLYGAQLPVHVLRQDDHGHAVRVLQRALRAARYQLVVDGEFGPQTHRVLVAFQRDNGIRPPTGKVDRDTRFMLATGGYA